MIESGKGLTVFARAAGPVVENTFLLLIEGKHLYQSVKVPVEALNPAIEEQARKEHTAQSYIMPSLGVGGSGSVKSKSEKQILAEKKNRAEECLQQFRYCIRDHGTQNPIAVDSIMCPLMTAKLFCNKCDGLWPHNRLTDHSFLIPSSFVANEMRQIFLLHFQCQSCRQVHVSFLVERTGLKLTLCGRSPIEEIGCPKFISNSVRKYYRGAMIAFNSGAILPAIAMLRIMIEQHMRQVIGAGDKRTSGDELIAAYAKKLDPDFTRQHQSLKPVYEVLSDALHSAKDDDPEVFTRELNRVLAHLEAKEVFERLLGKKRHAN